MHFILIPPISKTSCHSVLHEFAIHSAENCQDDARQYGALSFLSERAKRAASGRCKGRAPMVVGISCGRQGLGAYNWCMIDVPMLYIATLELVA